MKEGLKQRLVGAFVLIALAVIFLPGFFKEQQGHSVDTQTLIPLQPQVDVIEFTAPEATLEVDPAPAPETMFLPSEAPDLTAQTPDSAIASASASSATAAEVPTSNELPPVPELPLNASGVPDAWVVQVVSLSNKEAASKLRDELQTDGYRAYIREVTTDAGVFSRVFIGPKLDKAEALAIKAEMDRRFKVSAQVRRFEP